jgi:hypothetical protein
MNLSSLFMRAECQRPLLAESSRSLPLIFNHSNDRYREKQTLISSESLAASLNLKILRKVS